MASSRKQPNARKRLAHGARGLARGAREIAVGLSGGVDSVVLLHRLKKEFPRVRAIHIHHGLSPNADAWVQFCRALCRKLDVPLVVRKVSVRRAGKGLESAAREARYAAFAKDKADTIALAHNLDDQAETVLMNLLRGAGVRGASGMAASSRQGSKTLLRPLLNTSRKEILAYARAHDLEWVEDESNASEALTRNYLRHRIGPLLEQKFPQWRAALARAARHFASREAGREDLLRSFLRAKGLKAPSEAKLVEMLKQLGSGGARTRIGHDGAELRVYRGKLSVAAKRNDATFKPLIWKGEPSLNIPALGGELRFRKTRRGGIGLEHRPLSIRLRSGGERLQPDPRRPRRTLKNLFQETGVPPLERERLPLLFHGDELVWVPGVGIDARFQALAGAHGLIPEWIVSA